MMSPSTDTRVRNARPTDSFERSPRMKSSRPCWLATVAVREVFWAAERLASRNGIFVPSSFMVAILRPVS